MIFNIGDKVKLKPKLRIKNLTDVNIGIIRSCIIKDGMKGYNVKFKKLNKAILLTPNLLVLHKKYKCNSKWAIIKKKFKDKTLIKTLQKDK